jgi:phosphoserine phosphatase RsbU/P
MTADMVAKTAGQSPQQTHRFRSFFKSPLSLRFQLLVGVNATMAVVMAIALYADYRRELAHHLRHEQAALLAEAETIAAALPALDQIDVVSIHRLLTSVQSGMRSTDLPKHQLRVVWKGVTIDPATPPPGLDGSSTGRSAASNDPVSKRQPSAASEGNWYENFNSANFVLGECQAGEFTVYVAEPVGNLESEIGRETVERMFALILAGLVAMAVVLVILLRGLVRPLERLTRTVEAIGAGQLGRQVGRYRTAELSVLADSINTMSSQLAAHDRESRVQIEKARRLQQHLLPPWPAIDGLLVERRFLPATDVTGDYHEAFPLADGEWLFCIADVTGHGIPAAMTAAMLKVLFHQAAAETRDPSGILERLNTAFGEVVLPGDFATVFIVHWQPRLRQIRFGNAGHLPGALLRGSGELVLLESDGFMVGAVPGARWATQTISISEHDRLLMYTDGAIETFNANKDLFGRKRLEAAFEATRGKPPEDAVSEIIARLDEFRGERPFADDVTLLLIEFGAESLSKP